MALAEWRFIDHTTSQDAATRKTVRATVARNYRRKERSRNMQSYVHSHIKSNGHALRAQSSVQKQGESENPKDRENHEECTNNLNQSSGYAQTYLDQENANRDLQSLEIYNEQRHWAHASTCKNVTMYANPFATSYPAGQHEKEHGRLLHHCKLRPNFPGKASTVPSMIGDHNTKWLHRCASMW